MERKRYFSWINFEKPALNEGLDALRFEDENNVNYQYSVDQNKFYSENPKTGLSIKKSLNQWTSC